MWDFEAPRGVCLLLTLLGACSGPSLEVLDAEAASPGEYLTADGDRLLLGGEPYRFLSLNAFTLTGCGNDAERFDAERIETFFESLRPRSLVRTYAFSSRTLAEIEAVVEAAARHEHFLNLVLTHADGSCGDDGTSKSSSWYDSEFRDAYLPWVRELTQRFAGSPSVAIWELVSSPVDVPVTSLRAFYDEVGGVVHELAPRQLVASGAHGAWAYGGEDGYAHIHQSPGIDVAQFRDYEQQPGAPPNLAPALAALAGTKPLILAEAGVFASLEGDATQELQGRVCISWSERRDVLASWLEAAFATPLAGINIWNYLPVAQSACSYSTYDGDPLLRLVHDASLP